MPRDPPDVLDGLILRVVEDIRGTKANGPIAGLQWLRNPGIDSLLDNQPSIRIGVKYLEKDEKTFTEILAHEIGHHF